MIELLIYTFIFIAGAFIGSFLNVVVDRLENGEPIFMDRSHCDFCRNKLFPKDLIPVFSFITSLGKCRYCKARLSFNYPLSEILTGLSFVLAAYITQVITVPLPTAVVSFVYLLIIFSVYIVLLFSDLKFQIIPNPVVWTGIIIASLYVILNEVWNLYSLYDALKSNSVLGKYLLQTDFMVTRVNIALSTLALTFGSAILLALFFLLLIIVTKGRGMGGGDVRLALLIGIFNGFPNNTVAIFLGFVTGALYSLVLIILRKTSIKSTIPFGPFLILGSILAFFYGDIIISWYLSNL